ncbi:MAG: site-specific integrase [Candidatus Diapherotrites archaeon]|nr:site-specific integrase [Candidatus Diapherotrites archaeon]
MPNKINSKQKKGKNENPSNEPLEDDTIRKDLYLLSKKAGIHFTLYLARHSGATHKAQFLNSKELNAFLGHSPSSKMADIYIHFSGKEFDDKLIQNKKAEPQTSKEFFRFYEAYQAFQVYQEGQKKEKK